MVEDVNRSAGYGRTNAHVITNRTTDPKAGHSVISRRRDQKASCTIVSRLVEVPFEYPHCGALLRPSNSGASL